MRAGRVTAEFEAHFEGSKRGGPSQRAAPNVTGGRDRQYPAVMTMPIWVTIIVITVVVASRVVALWHRRKGNL